MHVVSEAHEKQEEGTSRQSTHLERISPPSLWTAAAIVRFRSPMGRVASTGIVALSGGTSHQRIVLPTATTTPAVPLSSAPAAVGCHHAAAAGSTIGIGWAIDPGALLTTPTGAASGVCQPVCIMRGASPGGTKGVVARATRPRPFEVSWGDPPMGAVLIVNPTAIARGWSRLATVSPGERVGTTVVVLAALLQERSCAPLRCPLSARLPTLNLPSIPAMMSAVVPTHLTPTVG
jgi:hypothetical protein